MIVSELVKPSFIVFMAAITFASVVPSSAWGEGTKTVVSANSGLQHRIDFGNSHILGQSIKSGAVYLMHRKKSNIATMIEVRQNYRNEIKEDFEIEKTAIAQQDANLENKKMSFKPQ